MRIRATTFATAVLAAGAVLLPALPAGAGSNHTIAANPTTLRPGDTTTITGETSCNTSAYVITLTYVDPAGDPATATTNGTTDASGEYTQPVVIPEDAVAGEDTTVQSNIATCGEGGGASASNTVALTIEAHEGTLEVDPTSGPTGTEVAISGTNCWGDDIAIAFTDDEFDGFVEVEDVTLNQDRTFTATFTIPDDAGPGDYFFVAECPGTDFEPQAFAVTATAGPTPSVDPEPEPAGPAAPPAPPVVDVVNFTG